MMKRYIILAVLLGSSLGAQVLADAEKPEQLAQNPGEGKEARYQKLQDSFDEKKVKRLNNFLQDMGSFEENAKSRAMARSAYTLQIVTVYTAFFTLAALTGPVLGKDFARDLLRSSFFDAVLPACTCTEGRYYERSKCGTCVITVFLLWFLLSAGIVKGLANATAPDLFEYQHELFTKTWLIDLRSNVIDAVLVTEGDEYYAKSIAKELKACDQRKFLHYIKRLTEHGKVQLLAMLKRQSEVPCQ